MKKSLAYLLGQACRMVCVWGLVCGAMCGLSACGWQEAKEVIAWADSIDQKEHMIYDDTIALSKAIRSLDNPFGRVLMSNTLGKAYYYMGRNYSLSNQIAEAADCYIEADRLQIDDPIYRGRVNSCIGYICAQNNNDSLALFFYERASESFKESGNDWYYAQTLLSRSDCHINLQQFKASDCLLQKALSYSLDSAYQARYYETRGLYFYAQQQYDSALVYFNQGLDYWQSETERCFSYLKIMQIHLDMEALAEALPFAKLIVKESNNPNYLTNAYYCLMLDSKEKNDIHRLSAHAHARADAQNELRDIVSKDTEAQSIISNYMANPTFWHRVWILLSIGMIVCVLLMTSIWIYRKNTTIRLQSANKEIDDLSLKIKQQEEIYNAQQLLFDFDNCLNTIRTKYPQPPKNWIDYYKLKKDIDPYLHEWINALEKLDLSNREKVFCVFVILYPHISMAKMAEYICYDKNGIRVFKNRITKKMGIRSSELYTSLRKLV